MFGIYPRCQAENRSLSRACAEVPRRKDCVATPRALPTARNFAWFGRLVRWTKRRTDDAAPPIGDRTVLARKGAERIGDPVDWFLDYSSNRSTIHDYGGMPLTSVGDVAANDQASRVLAVNFSSRSCKRIDRGIGFGWRCSARMVVGVEER
jgi:hypothetical protein